MYEKFVRERITSLRIKKGVSEYQMSYDLGHSKGYVNNISSGKALPSLKELFTICDYFEITPNDFFNIEKENPELTKKAIKDFDKLNECDMLLILNIINRLLAK